MTEASRNFRLRDARIDEQDAISKLTLLAYEQYADVMAPSAWQALKGAITNALATTTPSERIVAELDGVLVGSVMLFPAEVNTYQGKGNTTEAAVPELRMLAVSQAARGHNVGRSLVEECIRRARAAGASSFGLHTSDSMQTAKALYERMGFERYPADDFQPDGAELVMAYRLPLR